MFIVYVIIDSIQLYYQYFIKSEVISNSFLYFLDEQNRRSLVML